MTESYTPEQRAEDVKCIAPWSTPVSARLAQMTPNEAVVRYVRIVTHACLHADSCECSGCESIRAAEKELKQWWTG